MGVFVEEFTFTQVIVGYFLLVAIYMLIKYVLDKIGIELYPIMMSKLYHGIKDKNLEGPIKAFRYVYKYELNKFFHKNILFVLAAIIYAFVTIMFGSMYNLIIFVLVYIVYVVIVQISYLIKVYNRGK